jgi:hypothetical protein
MVAQSINMRNIRTLLIIAAISIIFCITLISFIIIRTFISGSIQRANVPKREPVGNFINNLEIIPFPQNGAKNVPVDSAINIKLAKPKSGSNISIAISPQISYKISNTSSLIVIYHEDFAPGTTYSILVSAANQDKTVNYDTFSFSTKGKAPKPININESENLAKKSSLFQLANHPDVYLSNNTPYESASFSIIQVQDDSGLMRFEVKSKTNKYRAKNDFISWTHSLGLSDEQLDKLAIIYR